MIFFSLSPFFSFSYAAQVITWFQNRRAKLKRDIEELKKDVESVKVLSGQESESFLKNVTDMNLLKKKPIPASENGLSPEKWILYHKKSCFETDKLFIDLLCSR